jgi:hypothetical protein
MQAATMRETHGRVTSWVLPGLMNPDVDAHFFSVLNGARVTEAPFPHLYLRNVFPEDYYRELVAALPPSDFYTPMAPPYQARLSAMMNPQWVEKLPAPLRGVWAEFEGWIHSQPFMDRIVAKFSPWLPLGSEHRRPQIAQARDGRVGVRPRTLIARDSGTFSIGPHTDSVLKFIVGIFYLPVDESMIDFGTSIYRPKQKGFREWASTHRDHALFEKIVTFENRPNHLLLFVKTDESFHGVDKKTYPDTGRDVVFWVPELVGKPGGEQTLSVSVDCFSPR